MFRVWFTTTGGANDRENPETMATLMSQLEHCPYARYRPATSADNADAIIFIEPNNHKLWNYPKTLIHNELIVRFGEKCFAHDYSDGGVVFLPGAYVCTPSKDFDINRARASGYYNNIGVYNAAVTAAGMDRARKDNIQFLFSFRGALSHPVRLNLLKQDYSEVKTSLHSIDRWFNHTEAEKNDYVQEILRSKFVLAPRGIGTASIRLFEIMQLGRAPVIISDDWVQPVGPAWNDFSIRVAQDKIADLPRVLLEREEEWAQMGELARQAWEQYYSPESVQFRLIEYVEDIMNARPASHDERIYQREWLGLAFAWRQKWTVPQRLYYKMSGMAGRRK